jgi:16S rRNA (uracil1498-N3)-methyltransferase
LTRRFYVQPGTLHDGSFDLPDALARRVADVLRLRAGDELLLFDGSGDDLRIRIERATGRNVSVAALGREPGPLEPAVRVHLYQSITKGERFEWLLEKATEIGVFRVIPIETARSVVRPSAGRQRAERWRRIVVEAAEQCGRGCVPEVAPPSAFRAAIQSAPGIVLLPYEAAGDAAPDIATALTADIDALFALAEVSLFIGPEGGFEPEEVEGARSAGAHIVTMGQRVLRSETAGIVALALVMHAAGQLG